LPEVPFYRPVDLSGLESVLRFAAGGRMQCAMVRGERKTLRLWCSAHFRLKTPTSSPGIGDR